MLIKEQNTRTAKYNDHFAVPQPGWEEGFFARIVQRETKVAVIGLGNKGMALVAGLAGRADVIGFDTDKDLVQAYRQRAWAAWHPASGSVRYTEDAAELRGAALHIIAIEESGEETADTCRLLETCVLVGARLSHGAIVLLATPMYPGMTESICIPVLQGVSGLRCGANFAVGYLAENASGAKGAYRGRDACAVIAASCAASLETLAEMCGWMLQGEVYRVASFQAAERMPGRTGTLPGQDRQAIGMRIADVALEAMARAGMRLRGSQVAVLGVAGERDFAAMEGSYVPDILRRLRAFGVAPVVCDPVVNAQKAREMHGLWLMPLERICLMDCVILAVAHQVFHRMPLEELRGLFGGIRRLLVDVEGIHSAGACRSHGIVHCAV